ncbi:MAG: acetyl-CoA synthetase, partial [Bacteroidales bacterium]|nr:acetyl-CoA synthetase [Bacteroidales bacterium]
MRKLILTSIACLGLWLTGHSVMATEDARMLRYPDINGKQIVFVFAGDIWTVDAQGGDARRLTSHKGLELFPKISPDGKWIAFSAEYSGNRQIYVMPSQGGTPRQLTYYNDAGAMPPRGGFDNVVLGWTPNSEKVLYRGNRTPYGERMGKYFTVSIMGGMEEALPIPYGGFGVLSPDGKKLVFA